LEPWIAPIIATLILTEIPPMNSELGVDGSGFLGFHLGAILPSDDFSSGKDVARSLSMRPKMGLLVQWLSTIPAFNSHANPRATVSFPVPEKIGLQC
jgi:hypothetical protein